jgi:hypothetical protein
METGETFSDVYGIRSGEWLVASGEKRKGKLETRRQKLEIGEENRDKLEGRN